MRAKLIGLGEHSIRKSYYPQLQEKINALEKMKEAAETAHQQLETALASISDGFATLDHQWRYTYVNTRMAQMIGKRREDLLGKSIWEEPSACLGGIFQEEIVRTVDEGRQSHIESHCTRCNRWFENHTCPSAEGVTMILRDITERKRAEDELKVAKAAAEQASLAKSQFLANMSHEIRTPMTAILGFADVLALDDNSEEERQQYLEIIRQNGQSLLQLINDILDLSRIEAEKMTVERTASHPRQLVDGVMASMRLRAAEKGLSLTAEFDPILPSTIHTDPTRLRQILVNLVGNAIKFTERGGVKIRVWTTTHVGSPLIHFAVTDSGIGVSNEALSRIFQPFTQADDSLCRRYGGSGLGLTICRRLAEMLGGTIVVDSKIGEGSTFTFSMAAEPLDASWAAKEPETAAPSPPAVVERPALQGRVLVADDVQFNRQLICLLLEKAGVEVEQAQDGLTACQMVRQSQGEGRPFDVVFMDVQMPVMDGYEATRCIHQEGYSGVIIALTAHAMDADRQKCLEAGCDGYLAKPVDSHELYAVLKRHLRPAGVQPAL